MRPKNILISCLVLAIGVLPFGCNRRTDKTDGGGILLSITDFDQLPITVAMNSPNLLEDVQIGSLTITSVVKDPFGSSGDLMNVELDSYEVTYQREDTGTRVPPKLVQQIFGSVPAAGTDTISNLPFMGFDQLESPPLSDLFFVNGGFDQETQSDRIRLRVSLRFFGRTLAGTRVETEPVDFDVDFVP